MTQRAYIDVLLEIPAKQLATEPDPSRAILEMLRVKADQECRTAGATLRTDSTPEIVVKEGHSSFIGDVTLVASRWAIDAPDTLARTL